MSKPREETSIINEATAMGIGIRNGKTANNLSLKDIKTRLEGK